MTSRPSDSSIGHSSSSDGRVKPSTATATHATIETDSMWSKTYEPSTPYAVGTGASPRGLA